MKAAASRKISITENGRTRRVSVLEAMVHRMYSEGLRSDKAAFKILLLHERYAEAGEGATPLEGLLPEDAEILAQFEKEVRNAAAELPSADAVEPNLASEEDGEDAP